MKAFAHVFNCQVCAVHSSVLYFFWFFFISLTVICLTETDTSKKHVNMCTIRQVRSALLTVVSLKKCHILNGGKKKKERCRRT